MKRYLLVVGGAALLLAGCPKKSEPQGTTATPTEKPAAKPETPAPKTEAPAEPTGSTPRVELSTTMGKIKLELNAEKAPRTVANFLKYVRAGHYNGTVFHRVIGSFMIQGGGFDTNFNEKQTQAPIQNEADNGLSNLRGTIAMARTSDPHSAGAQFFINVVDNQKLDHRDKTLPGWGYCVFGKVIEGMDTVDKIKAVATGSKGPFPTDVPQTDIVINEAKILR